MGIDAENGYLFTAISEGLMVWDARSTPANPTLLGSVRGATGGAGGGFLVTSNNGEIKWPMMGVDAPEGIDTMVGVVGEAGIGLAVFDTTDKVHPKIKYQSHKKDGEGFYATTINGRQYGFMAAKPGDAGGVFVYDLTAAMGLQYGCADSAPTDPGGCGGVYLGKLGTRGSAYFVHGVGNHVVLSSGASYGFEVWNVANPRSPTLETTGFTDRSVYGVAMWKSGAKTYLAARSSRYDTVQHRSVKETSIFDATCLDSGCGSLGSPIWTGEFDSAAQSDFLVFSRSGGTPFLYLGSDNRCSGSAQREWLLDVSSPTAPRDITPQSRMTVSGLYSGQNQNVSIGYWGWYYRGNPTGFNLVGPRGGVFYNDYFYRAGWSIMDVHHRTGGVAPAADFTWTPQQVYPGTSVSFTDTSTGGPTSWTWGFNGATPAVSSTRNPTGVQFGTVGPHDVTLSVSNAAGSDGTTKSVTVLDPAPAIGSVVATPATVTTCQSVTFSATGVTGQPTLGYSWVVKTGGSPVVPAAAGNGTTFAWNTGPYPAGTYTGELTVANGVGSATKSGTVIVNPAPALPAAGAFTPSNDSFVAGTVQFHVNVAGASEWSWDFGDGTGFTGWTSDPVNGPNPVHTYSSTGNKSVVVQVRNCVEGARSSATLTVNITQTTPLVAGFQISSGLSCFFSGICNATANQAITLADQSTGPPDHWYYAWQNTSSTSCSGFDAGSTSPVTAHTYTTASTAGYYPCLKVTRGAESQTFIYGTKILVDSATPPPTPSISVSGPSSGSVGAALGFTASTTNCSAGSFSWNSGGGTLSGSGAVVSITWSSAGTKSISVTHSGCGGRTAIKSVTINTSGGGGGGGGTLQAAFSFTPGAPAKGQAVTFDGTASTGSPEGYSWDFGDGTTAAGATATHAYAAEGSYTAKLDVTKPGSGCLLNVCVSEATKVVLVGAGASSVAAHMGTSASCSGLAGIVLCQVTTGDAINFDASDSTGSPTSYVWDFGDGTTANGSTASHTWSHPGTYEVRLTVSDAKTSSTESRSFQVSGEAVGNAVFLPWIAQSTNGALQQTSDLYVYNPGTQAMDLLIRFLKRGTPETNPPEVTRTLQPGATLYLADVVADLFERDNLSGFLYLEAKSGNATPVVNSFNHTFQDGQEFGQVVPGVSISTLSYSAAGTSATLQNLIGLNDGGERLAYFGLSNPNPEAAAYHLRFYDSGGNLIFSTEGGAPYDLARFGQKQFQVEQIRAELRHRQPERLSDRGGHRERRSALPLRGEPPSRHQRPVVRAGQRRGRQHAVPARDVEQARSLRQLLGGRRSTVQSGGLADERGVPLPEHRYARASRRQATRCTSRRSHRSPRRPVRGHWSLDEGAGVLTVDSAGAGASTP